MPEDMIICVDFGSTYSSVTCYINRQEPCVDHNDKVFLVVHLNDLIQISGYPHGYQNGKTEPEEVPSQLFWGEDGSILWGYTISHLRSLGDLPPGVFLARFKLLLDDRSWVSKERQDLEAAIKALGLDVEDVIVQFLTLLLEHTKSYLVRGHFYKQGSKVQLVATVPAIWNSTACMIMHRATQRAATKANFGQDGDVFLVAEPDAAATFFCQVKIHRMLEINDRIVICDMGGGTVDLVAYLVINEDPIRLKEIVAGDGALCGSSLIDDCYEAALKQYLRMDPRYAVLEADVPGGIDAVAEASKLCFERESKRRFNGEDNKIVVTVPSAPRVDKATANTIIFKKQFLINIFDPIAEQIRSLILSQMSKAKEALHGAPVKHVVLIGGFAASRYMQNYLGRSISPSLIQTPPTPEAAISSGGIMRFLNQPFGPDEILRTSYGFILDEQYNDEFEGHRDPDVKKTRCLTDKEEYVTNCIRYCIKKGTEVPAGGKTFFAGPDDERPELECRFRRLDGDVHIGFEVLCNDSDADLFDHYPESHPRNEGAKSQGYIDFVIPKNDLKSHKPQKKNIRTRGKADYFYILKYRQVIRIQGSNIRFELWFKDERKAVGIFCEGGVTSNANTVLSQSAEAGLGDLKVRPRGRASLALVPEGDAEISS